MKIDFSRNLIAPNGQLAEYAPGKPVTLGMIASNALNDMLDSDRTEDGMSRARRGGLSYRLFDAGEIDLGVEDVTLIKDRIGRSQSPAVVHACWQMLDPPADG